MNEAIALFVFLNWWIEKFQLLAFIPLSTSLEGERYTKRHLFILY